MAIMRRLKESTSAAHRELEDCLDLPRHAHSSGDYARLLGDFLGFQRPYESRLQKVWPRQGAPLLLRDRLRVSCLESDLRALGWTNEEIAGLPGTSNLPPLVSLADAMGSLYVMEGSTLGGRFIVGELTRAGLPAEAMSYFRGHGEATAEHWRAFGQAMETFAATSGQEDSIVNSAQRTFETMKSWLCRQRNV